MPRKPRWSVHLFLRSTPPTTSRMATTNPSLKRSPGQRYYWGTWKKKWFSSDSQVLTYYGEYKPCCILSLRLLNSLAGWFPENFGYISFSCPVSKGNFVLLIFLIITHWLSSSLGQSAPWGKLAPAVWNKSLTRLKRAFIEYWRAIRLQEIKINVLLLNIEHCHLWKKRLRMLATELRCVSSFRSANGSSPLMKIFSKASISLWNDIVL